jgi:hypothetical protein
LTNPTEEIVAELGYSLSLMEIKFPISYEPEQEAIEKLQTSYYELLPKITLNSEIANLSGRLTIFLTISFN